MNIYDNLREFSPLYNFAPHLYGTCLECGKGDTDYNIKDSPYFDQFTAVKENIDKYTNEDLRTIAYLARNYRDRVAYNPKNIDYYFQSIGLLDYDKTCFDIVAVSINCPCDMGYDIGYRDWLELEDGRTPPIYQQCNKGGVQEELYIESLDTPSEYKEGETPMK